MFVILTGHRWHSEVKNLDPETLSGQREVVLDVLNTLLGRSDGDPEHPRCTMWRGSERPLVVYGLYLDAQHKARNHGLVDDASNRLARAWEFYRHKHNSRSPNWFHDARVYDSHREFLVWQDPDFYLPRWPDTPEVFEEPEPFWPSNEKDEKARG